MANWLKQMVASLLRLLLVVIALPFYGLLFLFAKVGDFLAYLFMSFIGPSLLWLDKLRNWIAIQIELLRIYRDWLIVMIFDTSRDDLFKQDQEILDLADAKLLE